MKIAASILLCLTLCLSGCGSVRVVEKPVTVEVVRERMLPVPADLLVPCYVQPIPETLTYGEAIELWAKDRAATAECNGRLRAIQSLDGS